MKRLAILMAAVFALSLLPARPARAAQPGGFDELVFADDASRAAHGVTGGTPERLALEPVGEYRGETAETLTVAPEETVAFTVNAGGGQLTLEIEEMHNKRLQTFGYEVSAEGEAVYFRTFTETSAGPCHYFIQVPERITKGKDRVNIQMTVRGDVSVRLSRVWAYTGFDERLDSEGVPEKMDVLLLNGALGDGTDRERVSEQVARYRELFSASDMFDVGMGMELAYLKHPEEELYRILDNIISVTREQGVPFAVGANSWWAGTPDGLPDGTGGFFHDLKYQQIVYDPLNVDGRGYYKPTTPNIWSNTPWLTMNSQSYNELREKKYVRLLSMTSGLLAQSRLEGDADTSRFSIYTENEPVYWPFYAFNNSPDGMGDFSPAAVAAAKEDGVTLDPADGLSEEENLWLFQNLNDYIAGIAGAAAEGAGTDYVLVDNGSVSLPDAQLIDNFYTHMFDTNTGQTLRIPWNMFETHMTKNGHYGDETLGDESPQYSAIMDYVNARGKYAVVNSERSSMNDYRGVTYHYTYGADHFTVYNTYETDAPLLAAESARAEEPVAVPTYGRELFQYRFGGERDGRKDEVVASASGVEITPMGRFYVLGPDNSTEAGGEVTFRVDNGGKPFTDGLMVELSGRILSSLSDLCKMELFAGSSPSDMQSVAQLTELTENGYTFDISEQIDTSQSVAYFKVKMNTVDNQTLYNWTSLYSVRALTGWGENSGHADGFTFTRRETRRNNIWIQLRADAEAMLRDYREKAGEDDVCREIEADLCAGRYRTAKQKLMGAISLALPAKFLVRGHGRLGSYPVSLAAEDDTPVRVKLTRADSSFVMELTADRETKANITVTCPAGRYALTQEGTRWELNPDPEGELASDGTLVFPAAITDGSAPLPERFSAFCSRPELHTGEALAVFSQDSAVGQDAEYRLVPLADNVVIRRGPVGAAEADMTELSPAALKLVRWGERVELTMNAAGAAEKALIYYGRVNGTVTGMEEGQVAPETKNPVMLLTDDTGKAWRFGIDAQTRLTSPKAAGARLSTVDLAKGVGFSEGDRLTVDYVPYEREGGEYYAAEVSEHYIPAVSDPLDNSRSAFEQMETSSNLRVTYLDNNNASTFGLTTKSGGGTGSAIWKATAGESIEGVSVKYTGRAILGSKITLYASANGYIWKRMGSVGGGADVNYINDPQTVLMERPDIIGGKEVYIKAEIYNKGDTWGFLNGLEIELKTAEKSAAGIALPAAARRGQALVPEIVYPCGAAAAEPGLEYAYEITGGALALENGVLTAAAPGKSEVTAYVRRGADIFTRSGTVTVN